MSTNTINLNSILGGRHFAGNCVVTVVAVAEIEEMTLPAAKTGRLTTRTDDNTGTLTMDSGHGLTTGKIDVFWNVGGVKAHRRQMDGVVTGDSIAIDGGVGGILPADESAITAVAPTSISIPSVEEEQITAFGADTTTPGHCSISLGYTDTAYSEGGLIELNNGVWGSGRLWNEGMADTPFAGSTIFNTMKVSQGSTVAASIKLTLAI